MTRASHSSLPRPAPIRAPDRGPPTQVTAPRSEPPPTSTALRTQSLCTRRALPGRSRSKSQILPSGNAPKLGPVGSTRAGPECVPAPVHPPRPRLAFAHCLLQPSPHAPCFIPGILSTAATVAAHWAHGTGVYSRLCRPPTKPPLGPEAAQPLPLPHASVTSVPQGL